ncbi:TPA: GspS/AspS pilotin family protein [Vibrio vulnificus]|nr:GspS/AspS pilotin family protein [Vibrio vulnificus]
MFKKVLYASLVLLALAGCSSNGEKERQLELMASNRAGVLSAGLPIEYGPLKVMRISSSKNIVEIMMIYNTDTTGAKPTQELLSTSVSKYCEDATVRNQLDMGLMYRIKIRNSRGQLIIDEMVTAASCQPQ